MTSTGPEATTTHDGPLRVERDGHVETWTIDLPETRNPISGPDVVAATLAFHLGAESQMVAAAKGYDQAVEDALLETVDWRGDGYELFSISTFAGSSARRTLVAFGATDRIFRAHRKGPAVGAASRKA